MMPYELQYQGYQGWITIRHFDDWDEVLTIFGELKSFALFPIRVQETFEGQQAIVCENFPDI